MTGMVTAVAAAAVTAGTAIYGATQSGKAADAQAQAAANANATQRDQYNTTRNDQAPWRAEGGQAVSALGQFYGLPGVDASGQPTGGASPDYNKLLQSMPGYQFQNQQGNQAVQRDLAARGLLDSGAAGKALTQYGQGVASDYAGQYVNGLQSLAGLGQSANQSTGILGANAANQIGSNQIYAGNAAASGYANQSNAISSGLSGLSGVYGQYNQQMNAKYGPAYTGPNTGYAASGESPQNFDSFLNTIYSPSAPIQSGP